MKRVRKKDSAFILASQNVEDFLLPETRNLPSRCSPSQPTVSCFTPEIYLLWTSWNPSNCSNPSTVTSDIPNAELVCFAAETSGIYCKSTRPIIKRNCRKGRRKIIFNNLRICLIYSLKCDIIILGKEGDQYENKQAAHR